MKAKRLTKFNHFKIKKYRKSFSLTQPKSRPYPKFLKQVACRIQSKSKKFIIARIKFSPSPEPMLIYGVHVHTAWLV